MALKPHSIKFDDRVWEMAGTEASHLNMSTAEFVRGAVAARCYIARVRRDPAYGETLGDLYTVIDRYLHTADRTTRDEGAGPA